MTKSIVVFLETDRMYFRQFCAEDAELLFELDSDPEVMRFITKGHPTELARIQNEFIPRFLGYYGQSPPRGFWAAHLRTTGEFMGLFHLRPDKITPDEMELGYRLKRNAWGRGLATEGSRALIEKAFCEWGYAKISARTLAGNLASQRVMKKAGLNFECEFVYNLEIIPGWTEEERRAVKYSRTQKDFIRQDDSGRSRACNSGPSESTDQILLRALVNPRANQADLFRRERLSPMHPFAAVTTKGFVFYFSSACARFRLSTA